MRSADDPARGGERLILGWSCWQWRFCYVGVSKGGWDVGGLSSRMSVDMGGWWCRGRDGFGGRWWIRGVGGFGISRTDPAAS